MTNGKSVDFRTITVTKTVTGNMGDTEKSFDFTVLAVKDGKRQGFNINGIDSVDGQVKFSLKHGESVQFRIPAGTTAYITEDTYSGYRTSYKLNSNDFKRGSTASIESISENVEVQFVNNKEAAPNVGISIEPKDNQKYSSVLVVAILLLIGMLVSSAKSMREKS